MISVIDVSHRGRLWRDGWIAGTVAYPTLSPAGHPVTVYPIVVYRIVVYRIVV
jgi:hypothetical protein